MKNLRLLLYSNPLVVDKIGKRFLFWKDSGFIFTKNLISSLPNDYRFSWLVPEGLREGEKEWFYDAAPNIDLIDYPYSTSIHQNRYEFYGNVLKRKFPYTKDIDVIICNQPEVSTNLRVWGYNQRRDLPIIYSFFHWIDCKESRQFSQNLGGYFWRQYDGALNSDAIYLHKGYGKKLWDDEIIFRGVSSNEITVREYTPPPTFFGSTEISLPPNKKIILFNHRLNNTTNWQKIIEICKNIYERRQDFILWMTDENIGLKMKSITELPFVIVKHVPDESYGFLMGKAHFAVCNHKGYSTWNMAILDSICHDCFTVIPSDIVYIQMLEKSPVLFHNYDNLEAIMESLLCTEMANLKEKKR